MWKWPRSERWVGCMVGVDFGVPLTPDHDCASGSLHDTTIVSEDRLRLSKLYPDKIFGCTSQLHSLGDKCTEYWKFVPILEVWYGGLIRFRISSDSQETDACLSRCDRVDLF